MTNPQDKVLGLQTMGNPAAYNSVLDASDDSNDCQDNDNSHISFICGIFNGD